MLCKLLIYKDKLRITLEWIHSQGRAAEHGYSPGLSMAGNQQQQSRNQQQKETEPQGLTEQQKPGTLRSIETTSKEPAANQQSRTRCETIRAAGARVAQGLQGYRVAEQSHKRCERKETDTAQGHTQPAASSSEQQAARNPAEPHGLRVQSSEPQSRTSTKGHPQPCRGTHGGSGQRVGSEGVSHERTKFRCT